MYKEIKGDLIELALSSVFDVVVQGNNCFCRQKRGLAPQFVKAFGTDKFPLEMEMEWDEYNMEEVETGHKGDINKLGQIDYKTLHVWSKHPNGKPIAMNHKTVGQKDVKELIVCNCYTQYHWDSKGKPFDYNAFTIICKKLNHIFKGRHIGLPQIGAGLAGGDWEEIKNIIHNYLDEVDVTVVIYDK